MPDRCFHQDVEWLDIWEYKTSTHDKAVGKCNECDRTVCVMLMGPIGLVDEDGEDVDVSNYLS